MSSVVNKRLSNQEIALEMLKMLDDPIYAIEAHFKVHDLTQHKYVDFKLMPRQREIIKSYIKNDENIVTKPRQAGVSTTTAAYAAITAALASKNNPEKIMIIANKMQLSEKFLAGIYEFLLQVPRWVWGSEYYGSKEKEKKEIFSVNSKKHIVLPNGSEIRAFATSVDALRGFTPSFLIMDEAAFIDNGFELYSAAATSLSTGGKVTLISTPNGQDKLYYGIFNGAKKGKNNFNVVEMRWYEDRRYNYDLQWIKDDEVIDSETLEDFSYFKKMLDKGYKPTSSWYRKMCAKVNNDPRKIAQELDVSFLGSGGNVIHDDYIKQQREENVCEPIEILGDEEEIWIWEYPIEGHEYVAAVDVSRGDSKDFSTIVIIDFTTMSQVFEYRGKVPPDTLGQIAYEWATTYNAYTVVDNVGVGVSTVLKLEELNYGNLHYEDPSNKLLRKQRNNFKTENRRKIAGFNASGKRLQLVANLERMVRENEIIIRSSRIIEEMGTFIYNPRTGRPDHAEGANDDLLMALAMGLFIIQHHFTNLKKVTELNKVVLSSWVSSKNSKGNNTRKSGYYSSNNKNSNYNMWLSSKLR